MEIASFAEEHVQLYVTVVGIIIMVRVGAEGKAKSNDKKRMKKKEKRREKKRKENERTGNPVGNRVSIKESNNHEDYYVHAAWWIQTEETTCAPRCPHHLLRNVFMYERNAQALDKRPATHVSGARTPVLSWYGFLPPKDAAGSRLVARFLVRCISRVPAPPLGGRFVVGHVLVLVDPIHLLVPHIDDTSVSTKKRAHTNCCRLYSCP